MTTTLAHCLLCDPWPSLVCAIFGADFHFRVLQAGMYGAYSLRLSLPTEIRLEF